MKKLFAVFLIICVFFSLAGCTSNEEFAANYVKGSSMPFTAVSFRKSI